jgi:hypothetical protein
LSGGGASIGEVGLKTFQFLAEQDQPAGKPDPGAEGDRRRRPLHHPGQWFVGCRRAVGFRHQIQRAQSRQGSSLLQLRRGRSGPHQRKVQLLAFPLGREFRHQDGSAHQLHEDRPGDQKRLPDQSGLFLR